MNNPTGATADCSTTPHISIVITTYNSQDYLAQTLDSVLAQTCSDWELVISDDGSRDGTVAVADCYSTNDRRIRVLQGRHGGVAANRNQGFAATNRASEFVIFLDGDDLWEPDALETLSGILCNHPEYVSVHSICRCIDSHGRPVVGDDIQIVLSARNGYKGGTVRRLRADEPTTFAELALFNWICTPGLHLIRREVLEKVGAFDPNTAPCDDWDMWLRLSRHGPIGFIERPLLLWRRHQASLSFNSKWHRPYYNTRQKMLADPSNSPEQTRFVRRGFIDAIAATLAQSKTQLRQRRPFAATKHLAKASLESLLFLRANVSLALRSRRRGTSSSGSRASAGRSHRAEQP
jgi:glycosyltransferase involved in cell wall biosynthesis